MTQSEHLGTEIPKKVSAQLVGIKDNGSGNLLRELSKQKKQSLETTKKSPTLEKETYKIDKDLSVEQKLNQGWTKETDALQDTIFLQKDLGNGSYVRELLEGNEIEDEHKGEQKFNREAVEYLGLKDKLPKNYEAFIKIRGNDNQNFMQEYFSKEDKPVLTGFFTPDQIFRHFHDFGILEYCWLGDGNSISIDKNGYFESLIPGHIGCSPRFGLSLHLMKPM